jgi:iron complex outermembrane receptor protein
MRCSVGVKFAGLFMAVAPVAALAEHTMIDVADVVVTAVPMSEPLVIETDPRLPRQPLPAHDGADYLKTIPGFSVMRKGGTDGEPVLRGMAGSRINVLVDGQNVLGGCSMRMDAPTSYIFPEAYDELKVVKGPQTVVNGPGASAGTVSFNRSLRFFHEPGYQVRGSLLLGSFGRNDEIIDAKAGNRNFYFQAIGTHSRAHDYEDGNGDDVHSAYKRYSYGAALGLAVDAHTAVELSAARSDGWAAYADRGMDGVQFDRRNLGLRFEKTQVAPWLDKITFQLSRNDIDHIMDDYTLREPGMMGRMGWARLKHDTTNAKLTAELVPWEQAEITLGVDAQHSSHEKGNGGATGMFAGMGASAVDEDASFSQTGVFAEARYHYTDHFRLIGGVRADFWEADDKRNPVGMMPMAGQSDTAGRSRDATLHSAFVRLEHDLESPVTVFAGLGYLERFPDYWELISAHRAGTDDTQSAFLATDEEKTAQLDFGLLGRQGRISYSASVFYNEIDDFILIDYRTGFRSMMGYGSARNIDARTYGAEFDASYALNDHWKASGSLAYVRGRNETDGDHDLAQLPPMEGRLGLAWDNGTWFAGGLVRLVDGQDHYAVGQGNVAGKDIGRSSGFATASLHGGWRPNARSLISAGVDNLFDRSYAEFISRSGSNGMGGAIPGYQQTTRVNEPGRTLWLKGTLYFD